MTEFTIASHSIKGRRENNEDAVLALSLGTNINFLAVADGMGGYEGGEIASNLILFKIKQYLLSLTINAFRTENLKLVLEQCFEIAQSTISLKIREEPNLAGMGTTLTAILISGSNYVYGNIGDSRLFLITPQAVHQLTTDHTYIEEFRQKYREPISPGFIAQYSHVLTRTIDGKLDRPDIYPASTPCMEINPGEIFLLCSDGLLPDKVSDHSSFIVDIINHSGSLEEAACQMVSMAYENGSTDNISVICLGYQLLAKKIDPDVISAKSDFSRHDTIQIVLPSIKGKRNSRRKKLLGIIGVLLVFLFAGFAIISLLKPDIFDFSKETRRPQCNEKLSKITAGVKEISDTKDNSDSIQLKVTPLFNASAINENRFTFLRLVSMIPFDINSKTTVEGWVKKINRIMPEFIKTLSISRWSELENKGIVSHTSFNPQTIATPEMIIQPFNGDSCLLICYEQATQGSVDTVDYIENSGMLFFAKAVLLIYNQNAEISESLVKRFAPELLYLVVYDQNGNMVDNPFNFDETDWDFPSGYKKKLRDRIRTPYIIRHTIKYAVDLALPLPGKHGYLRFGFPCDLGS
ncbi:MAG: protein phosphatase 2C domain-containing protein [Bacteroidales bacterium]|nr:protein phosphatase 2C domain-containing protein [Bacteroidales bacterium]